MIPATVSPLRSCRRLGAAALVLLMVSAFTPAANFLDAWIAVPSVVAPAAAIVVLGAGGGTLDDGLPNDLSLRRALRGILLYRAGLAPVLVFSGSVAEIEHRVDMAQRLGVPAAAVLRAPGSHTTRDEAVRLRELLGGPGARRILLVTGEQHMIRARRVFERAGFEPLPVVAGGSAHTDTSPQARLELIRDICQELLARLYYRAAGYF
jgi:uncharacterized SAM-binding protein YcdF (DUF218 family)